MQIKKSTSILLLLILITLTSCFAQAEPVPPDSPPPNAITAAQPSEAFPPLVLSTNPEPGEAVDLTTPISIAFDQPMDQASVEEAFALEPVVNGSFDWVDETTVRFTPGLAYAPGERYEVTLGDSARSTEGLPLNRAYEFAFTTLGPLEVTNTQPAAEAGEIDPKTAITVLFNRPVVALGAIEDQGSLPDPLTFVPPVTGQGKWLNTSIYQFTPDTGFEPSTEYAARVAAGLRDVGGSQLAEDYIWRFSTASPKVVATDPDIDTIYVSLTPEIKIAFNQPMNRESVEAALRLENTAGVVITEGRFSWRDEGLTPPIDPYDYYPGPFDDGSDGPPVIGVETMIFTPEEPLDLNTGYQIIIDASARGLQGDRAHLAQNYVSHFQTVPELDVVRTYPEDGNTSARPFSGLEITFSAPVDPASVRVGQNLRISPSVAVTDVYTYFWDSDTVLSVNFPMAASSAYTVNLMGSIEGRYGQKLGQGETIRWETTPHDPSLFLHAPGFDGVSTYSAYTPTLAFVTVRNVQTVDFSLFKLSEADFVRLTGDERWEAKRSFRPDANNLVREWELEIDAELNSNLIYGTNLSGKKGGVLEPGLYYLTASADVFPEVASIGRPNPIKQVVAVSNYNLTMKNSGSETLGWLTRLDTGDPAPNVPIRFRSQGGGLATAVTDDNGVALGSHRLQESWKPRYAISDNPFAVAINYWQDGIERWNFGLSTEDFLQPFNGQIYTDRSIYRPGQTVHFKGILRQDDDARYSLPPGGITLDVSVFDGQGKEILTTEYPLNENGTFHGQLDLAAEAGLGFYSINAGNGDDISLGQSFQVAEFRKPEFLIEVNTDAPEYKNGDTIRLTAQANFFFGGPLANADVNYSLLSDDFFFNYTGPAGNYDFHDYDFARSRGDFFPGFGELIDEGTGKTDREGSFSLRVPADISDRTSSQRFTLEVTVTDPDSNQVVSSRTEAIVHKGDFYIGLRPRRYVGSAGSESNVDLITVDWESQPFPNQDLTVVFSEHNWYSVQVQGDDGGYYWESQVETIPVMTATTTTDDEGKAVATFVPPKGGIYQIEAQGIDGEGNPIRSSTFMWVSGREFVNWRQENNDRLELVTDKQTYQVGDVATVLLPHPYNGEVTALVTQERGHIYDYQVITLPTNSEQLKIPITEDMLPNMFISVVIIKAPDEATPLPSFKVGYAQLPIAVDEKEITITLSPDKPAGEPYRPGEEVSYNILATDHAGNPVAAEFSLALVDKAILTLAADQAQSLLDQFWRERGLGVGTAATLAISADRLNMVIAPEAKGGGGGGFDEAFGEVRGDFRDTAFWLADFETDADGRGEVTTTLPDNLTTWVLTARGISRDTLVGDEQIEIISTKPVLVRPVAPRFFVVGDRAELKMVIQNNTTEDLELEALFEGEGLTLDGLTRSAEVDVSLEAGGKTDLIFPVIIGDAEQVVLRFGAKTEGFEDAVELTLPVYNYSTPETVGTAGVLVEDGRRLEGIALPRRFDAEQGDLRITVDPSLAAGMRDGLRYLEHFPYECSEQTVSRFLPNVLTYRAYQVLNLDRPELEKRLPGLVSLALQRLYNQQNLDGGWSWWPGNESNPFLTAYTVLGLVEAGRAGFAVDEAVQLNAVNFLKGHLRQPSDVQAAWHANRQAFVLYVLAEAEHGDMGRTVLMFDQREKLDIYGRAYLALAFHVMIPDDSRITTLLGDITSAAVVSATGAHWEEAAPDFYNMGTDTRSTAIVLAALSRLEPDNSLASNAVRWLMSVREQGRWETTQETAWSIIALTDWMQVTGELDGNFDWAVNLNGVALGNGTVTPDNVDEAAILSVEVAELLVDEINRLVFERSPQEDDDESLGRLYYTAHLTYFKPVPEVKALDRGIVVARQYTLAAPPTVEGEDEADDAPPKPITEAKVGDIINVKLTIIAPNDLHYVKVEDPIPAGTEAIDTNLQTTSVVSEGPELTRERGPGWGWWWFNHTELRDEKAVLFADFLPKGTYEFSYQIRAGLPGQYRVIPSHAEEMYFPEVFGRGDGGVFTITE